MWSSPVIPDYHFHHLKRKLYPLAVIHHFLLPLAPSNQPLIYFLSVHLPLLDISYDWNHKYVAFLWLVTLSQHDFKVHHVVPCTRSSFYCQIELIFKTYIFGFVVHCVNCSFFLLIIIQKANLLHYPHTPLKSSNSNLGTCW